MCIRDRTQTDLPGARRSGLSEAIEVLRDIPAIGMAYLTSQDVVRHELVQQIVDAYAAYDRRAKENA